MGNALEEGTKICPRMPRFRTASVAVRGILVWELGQTCEAAGNGIMLKYDSNVSSYTNN